MCPPCFDGIVGELELQRRVAVDTVADLLESVTGDGRKTEVPTHHRGAIIDREDQRSAPVLECPDAGVQTDADVVEVIVVGELAVESLYTGVEVGKSRDEAAGVVQVRRGL